MSHFHSSVRIVAEAGVNHNGNIQIAEALIREAASAGADYIKFQAFHPESLVSPAAALAPYQEESQGEIRTQLEMLKIYALDESQLRHLKQYCTQYKIGFVCSVFDVHSLEILKRMEEQIIKIPSGEIDHIPLLVEIGKMNAEVWLSTGMATMNEIRQAVEVLLASGTSPGNIILMQCHSQYPTKPADANLKVIQTLQQHLGLPVGYSDHTEGITCAIAATALGAVLLEKHFTLDTHLPGPDHKASLNPAQFREMVKAIRDTEQALGSGQKRPGEEENLNKTFVRKSIFTRRQILKGEIFQEADLICLRPLKGKPAAQWHWVLNTPAQRDYQAFEVLDA